MFSKDFIQLKWLANTGNTQSGNVEKSSGVTEQIANFDLSATLQKLNQARQAAEQTIQENPQLSAKLKDQQEKFQNTQANAIRAQEIFRQLNNFPPINAQANLVEIALRLQSYTEELTQISPEATKFQPVRTAISNYLNHLKPFQTELNSQIREYLEKPLGDDPFENLSKLTKLQLLLSKLT